PDIDVEESVEVFFGDGPKGNEFANAGVREHNIDSPLHLSDGLVEAIKVGQLGNVSLHSRNVGAECRYGLVEFLLTAARDEDIGTLFDEPSCSRQPNPFCAAGDDGGFAFEFFGHLSFSVIAERELGSDASRSITLESEQRLAEVVGQVVRAAQQDGEAI